MEKTCHTKEPAASGRSPESLPDTYGTTRVVLLPVGPGKVHVYWEFALRQPSFSGKEGATKPVGGDDAQRTKMVLRFHEVCATGSGRWFDLEVDGYRGNRYVDIPGPGGAYVVEFGFRAATGNFFPASRSAVVETPPLAPAEAEEVMPAPAPAEVPEPVLVASRQHSRALEKESAPLGAVRSRPVVKKERGGPLVPVSASANIKFLSAALKDGRSREAVRAEMARLWRLDLLPDADLIVADALAVPDMLQPVDLTELCERRFLFGNSSK